MLNVIMLNVIMLNVIMLNVIMLSVIMLSVIMLNVIMLSDVMLKAVAPRKHLSQNGFHPFLWHGAKWYCFFSAMPCIDVFFLRR
jgi:hypothetical protein